MGNTSLIFIKRRICLFFFVLVLCLSTIVSYAEEPEVPAENIETQAEEAVQETPIQEETEAETSTEAETPATEQGATEDGIPANVQSVINLIDGLPTLSMITSMDKESIDLIRSRYDALYDDEKILVDNIGLLEQAEEKIEILSQAVNAMYSYTFSVDVEKGRLTIVTSYSGQRPEMVLVSPEGDEFFLTPDEVTGYATVYDEKIVAQTQEDQGSVIVNIGNAEGGVWQLRSSSPISMIVQENDGSFLENVDVPEPVQETMMDKVKGVAHFLLGQGKMLLVAGGLLIVFLIFVIFMMKRIKKTKTTATEPVDNANGEPDKTNIPEESKEGQDTKDTKTGMKALLAKRKAQKEEEKKKKEEEAEEKKRLAAEEKEKKQKEEDEQKAKTEQENKDEKKKSGGLFGRKKQTVEEPENDITILSDPYRPPSSEEEKDLLKQEADKMWMEMEEKMKKNTVPKPQEKKEKDPVAAIPLDDDDDYITEEDLENDVTIEVYTEQAEEEGKTETITKRQSFFPTNRFGE